MFSKKGFTLIEVLVSVVLVGMLSILCALMLIFSYSMYYKVANQKTSTVQYKSFRFTAERIFRNMTKDGPVIGEVITSDTGAPPASEDEDRECIKFDVEYYHKPYKSRIYTRKYNHHPVSIEDATITTRYKYSGSNVDEGLWEGWVGRAVSVYSSTDGKKEEIKRYMFKLRDKEGQTERKEVALYEWPARYLDGNLMQIKNHSDQVRAYGESTAISVPLLENVIDFQVTSRLSNLYVNRIIVKKYENIAVVRLYVKLEDDNYTQYTNDLIFANKSLYGDISKYFVEFDYNKIVL